MADPDGARKTICGKTWAGRLLAVLMRLAAVLVTGTGRAQQPSDGLPTEPILRIETGLHGAQINRIDTDAENHFAVTASDDGTVRVWSLPGWQLKQVVRLPADLTKIGKIHAVAITPDGATVAVGCCTGSPSHNNIFLFDRILGELAKRLPDLPGGVLHLVYSPDGKRLAASLEGRNGIRLFDVSHGYRPLPSDAQYKDSSYWATFDRAGRLVTTSDDGFVRLYTADRFAKPNARFRKEDHRPYSAVFSPDGTHVAVGYFKPTKVVVLSGSNLTQLFEADTAGLGYENLKAVAWSQDARFLLAGGEWSGHGENQVRRWSKGGRGPYTEIPVGDISIMEILGLKSGSTLFLHTDGFGLIDPGIKVHQLQQTLSGLDLQSLAGLELLQVSADGSTVQVEAYQPRHVYRFALGERRLDIDPQVGSALQDPITHDAPGLVVRNWNDSQTPTANGTRIILKTDESARSLAIAPDARHFVLGADWSLRLLDPVGRELWAPHPDVPGEAWHVNVTGEGRLVVVAYGDGTIRWLRLSDGKELLALFIHPDGKRWVAWTPQGYYDASAGGDELIGWQINRGYDRVPEFYKVSQFRDQFNRPDIVALVLKTLDVGEAVRRANEASGRKTAAPIEDSQPPVVRILSPPDHSSVAKSPIEVTYLVRSPTPVTGITVLVGGRQVKTAPAKEISNPDGTIASVSINMPQHDAEISLVATNEKAPSDATVVSIVWAGTKELYKPDLYVLAVGVSKYADKNLNLIYPKKDAEDFVDVMKHQEGGFYNHVYARPLTDEHARLEEIRRGLSWLVNNTTRQDYAMLFLSGHGENDLSGRYHYLTFEANHDPLEFDPTTLQDNEILAYLQKVPGKIIAFLDTCFSGALHFKGPSQPDVDKITNELAAAEDGVIVFTSSTGQQFSQEKREWNNSAFTKALVEAIKGKAVHGGDRTISIAALGAYLSQRVEELTDRQQSPPPPIKPKTIKEDLENFVIATVVP